MSGKLIHYCKDNRHDLIKLSEGFMINKWGGNLTPVFKCTICKRYFGIKVAREPNFDYFKEIRFEEE